MRTRLKELRLRRLLTQEDLAKKSGVGVTTIIRVEAGREGRISTLRRLAAALDVSPEELLAEPEEGKLRAA